MNKKFYVFSETTSFALINAFIIEVGKLGVFYNHNFSKLTEENYRMRNRHLFFSNTWIGQCIGNSCSLSVGSDDTKCFCLETNWKDAIEHVKEWVIINKMDIFDLNDKYKAEIDYNTKTVKVGCQTFSFQKIQELTKLLDK